MVLHNNSKIGNVLIPVKYSDPPIIELVVIFTVDIDIVTGSDAEWVPWCAGDPVRHSVPHDSVTGDCNAGNNNNYATTVLL